jgi:transposase
MGFIRGEGRNQGTLFPVMLEDLVPADHVCRVIDAFVDGLAMGELGFERAVSAETGRPGYDPRDLLKLYLYGYLNTMRSSRRLEAECRRNVELMWLLGRLYPDHKSIAEFRRMHREAVTAAGAQLVRFAQRIGLIRGEWIAIDGTKFRAVASADSVRERQALERYLDTMDEADEEQQAGIDPSAVQSALEELKRHPEPEAGFMRMANGRAPAYNVQTAVDAEHALIVAQQVTTEGNDQRCLQPMAEAAKQALAEPPLLNVVADAGYSNGEQAEACEASGITPYVPVRRGVNNHGDGILFDRTRFRYDPASDTFQCPAGQTLMRKQLSRKDRAIYYAGRPQICGACSIQSKCTTGAQRLLTRHLHDEALQRMQQRTTPAIMRLRRSTVEHPFATLKYRIFGHPRLLLRGRAGAQTEITLGVMAYNLKRMFNILGGQKLAAALPT